MARGSLGDVVLSRRYGQQVAAVRTRTHKRTNTPAQQIEKACLATVSQAYKACKKIVSKSFEGFKNGSATQAEFNSRNIAMIRQGLEAGLTRVVEYKATMPVANPYVIASGSLDGLFTMDGQLLVGPGSGETLKEFCKRIDLRRSDVFAVCLINSAPSYNDDQVLASYGDVPAAKHMATRFGYYQFKISAAALASDAVALSTDFKNIWDVSHPDVRTLMADGWGRPFNFDAINLAYNGSMRVLMCGVVRLRSTGRLRNNAQLVKVGSEEYSGISYEFLQAAWAGNTADVSAGSDNVLDGSGFNGDGTSGGSDKPKKLPQLLAKYWVAGATFYYVLMGEFRGVINPVIQARYLRTDNNKLVFDLRCVAGSSGNFIVCSDDYGNLSQVPVFNPAEVGEAVAGDAAYIANNSQNATYYAGWHTQYKSSGIYEYSEAKVYDPLTVQYRSYNKS